MVNVPKEYNKEEEFFARQEFERRKKLEAERAAHLAEQEVADRQKLHYMHCPKCGSALVELDYKDLKIDKCSGCEGVWLDPGELEQIVHDTEGTFGKFLGLFK
jgi:hypothetical protein